ncbi:hypothetical protein DY023_17555 [Microbacterium bovistercoris]|uniref:Uncharacterized protein n=1 Tax=Microbacterium bovistercoris TaxID=2293570 RepID=A0A371NPM7_9MICO|nr:hypothetical protein [Microbacterium bovistercoris]REJ04110.1 hypothetical protein DY023_17555 [Microbacterium bovistercoris]
MTTDAALGEAGGGYGGAGHGGDSASGARGAETAALIPPLPKGDGLQIMSGGAIAVDTEDMRAAAVQLDAVATSLGGATDALRRAWQAVDTASGLRINGSSFGTCAVQVEREQEAVVRLGEDIRRMADIFEYVDLCARRESLAVNFPSEAAALQERIDTLLASDPAITEGVDEWLRVWEQNRYSGAEVTADALRMSPFLSAALGTVLMPLGLQLVGHAAGIRLPQLLGWVPEEAKRRGLGTIEPGERLTGRGPAVEVDKTVRSAPSGPPAGTRAAFERLRGNKGGQQVRIDKYAMPDGSSQYQVFIDGTDDPLDTSDSPWDMTSNVDMYLKREASASYEAVELAMAEAGIEAGDTIDIVGYSQGAMIGSFLAAEGVYDVRTLTTFGNPTPVALGERTLVADIRHTDDLVGGALSAGGSAGTTGSSDSFVAVREADALLPVIGSHFPSAYEETAGLLDASGDPRPEALQQRWNELNAATKVESFSYRAREVG